MSKKDQRTSDSPDSSTEQGKAGEVDRRAFLQRGALGVGALAAGFLLSNPLGAAEAQSAPESGQSLLYTVIKRGYVQVGTDSSNPPWHFTDSNGKLVGMDIDMGRLVARGLFDDPEKVKFVLESPGGRIPNLLTNKVDVVFQFMTISSVRAQQVQFTEPYYREGIALIMKSGSNYADYKALKAAGSRVKVSILQNVDAETSVHEALPEAQVVQLSTQGTVIQAAESGRVDAAAVDQSTSKYLSALHPDKYKDSGFGWHPQLYGGAIRPGDFIWLQFLSTVLKIAMSGTDFPLYQASFKKWFGVELASPQIGYPLPN